jgi:hypothetical protein
MNKSRNVSDHIWLGIEQRSAVQLGVMYIKWASIKVVLTLALQSGFSDGL